MNTATLLASTLFLLFQQDPHTFPTQHYPIRTTFAVAAETVIDYASAIDLKGNDAAFDAQMQQLKSARNNLATMAEDDRERDVSSSADNLIFQVSACHLQAKNGAPTDKCQTQIASAQTRMMETISKHKSGGSWIDGPPSP